jgi:hypothetical protein
MGHALVGGAVPPGAPGADAPHSERRHVIAPRIDHRPHTISSGGITRIGDAINIRLTDWAEHRSRPCSGTTVLAIEKPSPSPPSPKVTASCRHDTGRQRQFEPGASNRNGSHRHRVTITARDRRPIEDGITSSRVITTSSAQASSHHQQRTTVTVPERRLALGIQQRVFLLKLLVALLDQIAPLGFV